jgi:hypothetical protein
MSLWIPLDSSGFLWIPLDSSGFISLSVTLKALEVAANLTCPLVVLPGGDDAEG